MSSRDSFRRGEVGSTAERVTTVLRNRILSGEVGGGARLQQAEVADELQVSRIPVRDALQRLAGEGLVELHGKAGATVAEISVADLQELYELRGAVEPLASRLAMPNVGRAQVRRMHEMHEALQGETDPKAWTALNAAFHAEVYRCSGRPRMIELVEQLRRQTDRYLRLHLQVIGNVAHLHTEHEDILRAAEEQDATRVEHYVRLHLATSHDFILSYLLKQSDVSGTDRFFSEGLPRT